jgi:HK97 family phage major capsid protein
MRKKALEKRMQRLKAKKAKLAERAKASENAAEVRDLTEQLDDVNAEIEETQEELDAIEEEERQAQAQTASESRAAMPPADAQLHNGSIVGSFAQSATNSQKRNTEDPLNSMEYRQAFMKYVQNGTPIPAEFRAGEAISTKDTGAAIPMTVMNEVINTVRKRYGNLYSKVRKISVRGGVEYPVGALQAKFKWINESAVSPRQKTEKLGKVSFGYHVGEIRIAQTFLSQILTLSSFEEKLTEVIAVAYLEAMDYAIVNGSGDGAPLGILKDPRVTNTITMTAAQLSDWTKWRKNFFAKIPLGYRAGEFIFAASTVDAYLETMQDANGNPIFRQATGLEVNDGDAANPNGRFFGREISLVEPDIIADFDAAEAGDTIGIFWQPEAYAINENFGFTMRRYFDEETNEWVDKALVVVDGKTLNPTGFYKIIKG